MERKIFPSKHKRGIIGKKLTCSGIRRKGLFPMMKEMGGRVSIMSQSIKDFPPGLGSFSHSLSTKIIHSSMKINKVFMLEN